jgi:prepilin-type N-terminal cleavage/methylation domain-containing protein
MRQRHDVRRAFTLVELLVVIGIIAVLIGILLPALSRARLKARQTQDLSNIRQMAVAAINYATNAKGAYPVGTQGGPFGGEDMAWINNPTADYFLQFCTSRMTNGHLTQFTDLDTNPQLGRVLCCNAVFDNAVVFGVVQTGYYAGYNEEQMGWIYWGGRRYQSWNQYAPGATAARFVPQILYRDGTTGSYVMPLRQGDHPTSRTLLTCYSYLSPNYYNGIIPHQINGGGIAKTVSATNAYQFISADKKYAGLCMAYTDGSARFVPAGDMGAVVGASYYYYDTTAH